MSEAEGPVNIGNPTEYSILEFATRIIALTGSTSQIIHNKLPEDDPKVRRPDITRARTLLGGWEPRVTLEEGLGKTIEFFRTRMQPVEPLT